MSNLDKYWNSGWPGTVTLTDEGLLFEDFEDFDFLCGLDGESRLFEKDDRVEDIFPYLNPESESGEKKLQGLWMTDDGMMAEYQCRQCIHCNLSLQPIELRS